MEEPLTPLILHIPHSSAFIPEEIIDQQLFPNVEKKEDKVRLLKREQLRLVDWYTRELFTFGNDVDSRASQQVSPISRLVVDMERFDVDAWETAAKVGMGTVYHSSVAIHEMAKQFRAQHALYKMILKTLQLRNRALFEDHHDDAKVRDGDGDFSDWQDHIKRAVELGESEKDVKQAIRGRYLSQDKWIKYTVKGAVKPYTAAKKKLMDQYYWHHHDGLDKVTQETRTRANFPRAVVLDCHSFPDDPLPTEEVQVVDEPIADEPPSDRPVVDRRRSDRPDICIGSDNYHTPAALVQLVKQHFVDAGYKDVTTDAPFAGALIPNGSYGRDANVHSVMVEINRRLYMDEEALTEGEGEDNGWPKVKRGGFLYLQQVLRDLRVKLVDYARNGVMEEEAVKAVKASDAKDGKEVKTRPQEISYEPSEGLKLDALPGSKPPQDGDGEESDVRVDIKELVGAQ